MQLEADRLFFGYKPNGNVLTPQLLLSFSISAGCKVALLGPAGSGKSTTLALLAGLITPISGVIRYNGEVVRTQAEWRCLRPRIGISLQQPETQFFAATVWDEVQFAPLNYGVPYGKARHMANQALMQVNLDPNIYGPMSPFLLSGGEQRRVALASVLVMQPSLLLLDEPLAGMDTHSAQAVWRGVTDYLNRYTCTCIVATHDYERVWSWADHILVLDEGRLRFNGPRSDYKAVETDETGFGYHTQIERLRSRLCASGWHLLPKNDSPEALAEAVYKYLGMSKS